MCTTKGKLATQFPEREDYITFCVESANAIKSGSKAAEGGGGLAEHSYARSGFEIE